MFKYLIRIHPLGMLYGSAGAFLSPENLVGRAGAKFPPEAATLAGLFFSVNKQTEQYSEQELRDKLYVAGPFWGERENEQNVYVPIPRTCIIENQDSYTQWKIKQNNEQLTWYQEEDKNKDDKDKEEEKTKKGKDLKSKLHWFPLKEWNNDIQGISKEAKKPPWQPNPILHPKLEKNQRCTEAEDSLFLEYAMEMEEKSCLVYFSTYPLKNGWYKFGGENHLVEIESIEIQPDWHEFDLFNQPINAYQAFALLTPAAWGSSHLSERYPKGWEKPPLMLTDKPIPYRYSAGGRLGRGRYAVPAGSVYVLEKELKPWWEWDEKDSDLFPKSSLKHLGCGLALPLNLTPILFG